jgi:hypothetical protein
VADSPLLIKKPHIKTWLESTNQLGLTPQLLQLKEENSLIAPMQQLNIAVTVLHSGEACAVN